MSMNPLAGLLRGHSHNGKSGPLTERDVTVQLYGERSIRHHAAAVVLDAPRRDERPRDARGRFVARSAAERAGG